MISIFALLLFNAIYLFISYDLYIIYIIASILIGTVSGVISSVFVSLNSIYTSKLLSAVDNDKSKLLYYNNFNAAILFIPLIFMFEIHVCNNHIFI